MNNINFNYWLQGYFEILPKNDDSCLSDAQVKVIKEHLELVKKVEPLAGFAAWIEGYIDADIAIVPSRYRTIADKLNASFQHAVASPLTIGQPFTIHGGSSTGIFQQPGHWSSIVGSDALIC